MSISSVGASRGEGKGEGEGKMDVQALAVVVGLGSLPHHYAVRVVVAAPKMVARVAATKSIVPILPGMQVVVMHWYSIGGVVFANNTFESSITCWPLSAS